MCKVVFFCLKTVLIDKQGFGITMGLRALTHIPLLWLRHDHQVKVMWYHKEDLDALCQKIKFTKEWMEDR